MILLEKCDTPLKSWLREQDRVNDDVLDAMIDFTTDIARALKHLHDLEVAISSQIYVFKHSFGMFLAEACPVYSIVSCL